MADKIQCPGHGGVCKFCKTEEGLARYMGGSLEVDSMGNAKIDCCCKACANNLRNVRTKFDPVISQKLGHSMPKL